MLKRIGLLLLGFAAILLIVVVSGDNSINVSCPIPEAIGLTYQLERPLKPFPTPTSFELYYGESGPNGLEIWYYTTVKYVPIVTAKLLANFYFFDSAYTKKGLAEPKYIIEARSLADQATQSANCSVNLDRDSRLNLRLNESFYHNWYHSVVPATHQFEGIKDQAIYFEIHTSSTFDAFHVEITQACWHARNFNDIVESNGGKAGLVMREDLPLYTPCLSLGLLTQNAHYVELFQWTFPTTGCSSIAVSTEASIALLPFTNGDTVCSQSECDGMRFAHKQIFPCGKAGESIQFFLFSKSKTFNYTLEPNVIIPSEIFCFVNRESNPVCI